VRVHHLNCGTLRPPSERLVNGAGSLWRPARMVCHCLLVETDTSLVLIDSGIGSHAATDPQTWLGRRFLRLNRPLLDPQETALHQVARLGYDPGDIRHVVLTHLDRDHAGGIADFPHAQVHVYGPELRAAQAQATKREQSRYLSALWAHRPRWVTHDLADGERWYGFDAVRPLDGLSSRIALIPLTGHTRGHVGVAVDVSTADAPQWLLHAGDAYFHHGETDLAEPRCTPGLALFQHVVQHDDHTRRRNQQRLRELAATHGSEVTVFSAHDHTEYQRLNQMAGKT
jgi:glyoxylase-like metal-dependent hydrolase (beta-lactamase superfamily II)